MDCSKGGISEFGEFRLDIAKRVLWRDGSIVPLPLKAVDLLCVLLENRGEVVTKTDLLEKVWGQAFVEESVLTQNIYLLRKTLRDGGEGDLIQNLPRRGYIFRGEVRSPNDQNSGEVVIERHLFERVQLEEASETKHPAAEMISTVGAPSVSDSRRRKSARYFGLAALSAVLLASMIAAVSYFRGESTRRTYSPPPVKLKAVSSPSRVKSVAVLIWQISDENEKAFASTFARDLSSRLGSLNKFTVKPFAVSQKHQETGAGLPADFALDGAIEIGTSRWRASAKLVDVKSGTEVWAQKFEETGIIGLQDAITNQVASAILNQMTAAECEQISRHLPTNIPAYETYLNGFLLWRKRAEGSTAYFKKAIELDANFAAAYVGLASQEMMGARDSSHAEEAEVALNKALELDEASADAYGVRGFIAMFHEHDWQGAEAFLLRALEMDPNSVNAHHWLGVFYSIHRRLDKAKAEMYTALELDPTNPTLLADIGQLHYFAGENNAAKEFCRRALALDSTHGLANLYLGTINQPQEIGNKKEVLRELERAADSQAFTLPYINVDPRYESLRSEPRYRAILKKMGLNDF